MSQTLEFAYRIEAGARMARNTETGEICEAYMSIKHYDCRDDVTQVEYDEAHKAYINGLSDTLNISTEFITPISLDEYYKETGENDKED